MHRRLIGLTIVFAIVASFGLTTLFANVPTTAAVGPTASYVGCAGINQWNNAAGPKGITPFDFSGEPAGAVINITGVNVDILVAGSGFVIGDPGGSSASYTTNGSENWIELGKRAGGTVASASCTLPGGEKPGITDDGILFYDNRLNPMDPHAPVTFFPVDDGIHVYWSNGDGLVVDIDEAFLADKPGVPGQNSLIWESGLFELWVLADGSYQFMYGPDADGNVYGKIFDAMPPTTITNASYNIYGNAPKW